MQHCVGQKHFGGASSCIARWKSSQLNIYKQNVSLKTETRRCARQPELGGAGTCPEWRVFSVNCVFFLPIFASDTEPTSSVCCSHARLLSAVPRKGRTCSASAEMMTHPPPGRLLNPSAATGHEGVYRATILWEKIVTHLERSVKCGRHSLGFRSFGACFPGSKAVECLIVYLNTILPKTTKRSQVRVLCEKLLLTGVLEDVRNKDKTIFYESRLYRFTGHHFWKVKGLDTTDGAREGSRSRSAEPEAPLAKVTTTRPGKKYSHTKGYASDSTLASTSAARARQFITHKPGSISTSRAPYSKHSGKSNAKLQHVAPQEKSTQHTPMALSLQQSVSIVRQPLAKQEKQSGRSAYLRDRDKVAVPGRSSRVFAVNSTRDTVLLRREKYIREDTKLVSIRTAPDRLKTSELDKRYSLQGLKERDMMLQSCRNEGKEQAMVVNIGAMHRSHSFSSTGTTVNPSNWVVYGYI